MKQLVVKKQISLHDKNWFQTGGLAEFFCEPLSLQELSQAIVYAQSHRLPITFIGEGANILISDEGIKGLVIRLRCNQMNLLSRETIEQLLLQKIELSSEQSYIYLEAGASLHDAIEFCLNNNLGGLEEFSGIPGTVGGSTFINVHYFNFLLSDFIVGGYVMSASTGEGMWVSHDWFEFDYDFSRLHSKEFYCGALIIKLKQLSHDETVFAQGRRAEIIRHRNYRYPTSHTCGSFFRNFHDHEIEQCSASTRVKFVSYYFDVIGVKGNLRVGGAMVSRHHANMIVNDSGATSSDIISLARLMQQKLFDQFQIIPQPECQLLGFSNYPLLH